MDETADYLQLFKSHLYKMTHSQKIPFYEPNGKRVYFHKEDLDKWIQSKRVKSLAEIEQVAIDYVDNRDNIGK
ncbi:MAG: helix-turn-helix domain-containing protein [Ignavibacteriaceae bacterium]